MVTRSIKSKLLIILGPTSTGKTDLALYLAKKFNGELISCDSRQVYVGLDIGTGKMPGEEVEVEKGKGFWLLDGVKVWMYDMVDPKKQYTVADYVKDTSRIIEEIRKRGKLPIIVGGTGFYLKALLEGLSNLTIPVNLKLRKELEKLSLDELQKKLQEVSPQRWGEMNNSDRQNPRRLIRAIEIVILKDFSLVAQNGKDKNQDDVLKIGLTAQREILYKRIDERVVARINQGMINEAERLHKAGLSLKRMRQLGLEYGVLADYLESKITSEQELIEILQGKIHGYARRQITWYKKEKNVIWFDVTDRLCVNKVEELIGKWYDIRRYAAES
ncbi:MAG: tRNA (adenosine(37)-N6)-dimethylallyltransferase MiaA [bacterium]|nr:tRNA (adenosine(37)-N6)-dimethylallyltransferase MiaA [bacterium]